MAVSRRARDRDGKIIEPMTLANMRENGVHSVVATCGKCRHEGVLDVQRWPANTLRAGRWLEASMLGLRRGEIWTPGRIWLEQGERRIVVIAPGLHRGVTTGGANVRSGPSGHVSRPRH
jgi:hypothetical protein